MTSVPSELGLEVCVGWFEVIYTFFCYDVLTNKAMHLGWMDASACEEMMFIPERLMTQLFLKALKDYLIV